MKTLIAIEHPDYMTVQPDGEGGLVVSRNDGNPVSCFAFPGELSYCQPDLVIFEGRGTPGVIHRRIEALAKDARDKAVQARRSSEQTATFGYAAESFKDHAAASADRARSEAKTAHGHAAAASLSAERAGENGSYYWAMAEKAAKQAERARDDARDAYEGAECYHNKAEGCVRDCKAILEKCYEYAEASKRFVKASQGSAERCRQIEKHIEHEFDWVVEVVSIAVKAAGLAIEAKTKLKGEES